MTRLTYFITVTLLALGCGQDPPRNSSPPSEPKVAPAVATYTQAVAAEFPDSPDLLSDALAINSAKYPLPGSDFAKGEVSPAQFDSGRVTVNEHGFTIAMPSEAAIPTPTMHRGRLYVSGGFSSREFYCFDAHNGAFIWGVNLSDDGPSSAVPYEDSIIFGTESCTLFALDAASGSLRWAYYLGDPMMSAPSICGDFVVIAYPATAGEPAATDDPATDESAAAATDPFDDAVKIPPAEERFSGTPTATTALVPTYVLACLHARTGEVIWRRWIDGDCISAPVASHGEIFVATLPGTLYRFRASDGAILTARQVRATSAPVVTDDAILLTRRTDDGCSSTGPMEAVVRLRRADDVMCFLAAQKPAPYLDSAIQRASAATTEANGMENKNGIGGGFGGGFFSVQDNGQDQVVEHASPTKQTSAIPSDSSDVAAIDAPQDSLAKQQQAAASNLGLGNVSTLQLYQGSRALAWGSRIFNCMGNELVCSSATSGEQQWKLEMDGDQEKLGGHMAAPPIFAGSGLIIATVTGDILQVDARNGTVHARYKVGSPVRSAPVVADGRVYVGTQDGKLVCIDTGDARIDGWPMWGGDPGRCGVVSLGDTEQ